MVAGVELTYNTGASAIQMADAIFGDDVTVVSANYSGSGFSSAIYSDGDTIAPGVTPGDTGVILSTGRATSFTSTGSQSNQNTNTTTNTGGQDNNPDFNALAGASTFDASILSVDFIPTGDTLTMQFVYSSEEYPEFTNSIYNDIVGVWVNGAPVELAVGSGQSNIGNINDSNNENLYNDNTSDQFNTEMDGFTVTLSLTFPVTPGQVNSITIGIADVGDSSYDSNLLIAGDSIQGQVLLDDDEYDIVQGGTRTIDVLGNDTNNGSGVLTITHINGIEVTAGDTILLNTGQEVTLNADGTFTVENDLDLESINFSYTAENDDGIEGTAFVTINTIPCFVAGTAILTDKGERPVEELEVGDMVLTHDNGPQPIRWVGQRTVEAEGTMAPILITTNALGRHGALRVSPQHRVLVQDLKAELLFGEQEVLIAAKDLVNDVSIRREADGTQVTYVHLLFDEHQVIYSEGLPTESFLPGPQTMQSFETDLVDEICTLFPELDPETGLGYGASARPALKSYEAQLLAPKGNAA